MPSFFAVLVGYYFLHELQNIRCLRHVKLLVLKIPHFFSICLVAVDLALSQLIHTRETLSRCLLELLRHYLHIIHWKQVTELNRHQQNLVILDFNQHRQLVALSDVQVI